jgi:hypothetical protein
MKKLSEVMFVAGAAALAYFLIRKKLSTSNENITHEPLPAYKKHHLTNTFANAKKHALHSTNNT